MTCDICETEIKIEKGSMEDCPECGQAYKADYTGVYIMLNEEQIEILRMDRGY